MRLCAYQINWDTAAAWGHICETSKPSFTNHYPMKTALYLLVSILSGYSSIARHYRNPDEGAGMLFAEMAQHCPQSSESVSPVASAISVKENVVSEPKKPANTMLTANIESNILTIGLPDAVHFISIWNLSGKVMYEQK